MVIQKLPSWDNTGRFSPDLFENGYNINDKPRFSHYNYIFHHLYELFNNSIPVALLYSDNELVGRPYPMNFGDNVVVKGSNSITVTTIRGNNSYDISSSNPTPSFVTIQVQPLAPNDKGVLVPIKVTEDMVVSCTYLPYALSTVVEEPDYILSEVIPTTDTYKPVVEGSIEKGVPLHVAGVNKATPNTPRDYLELKVPIQGDFPSNFNVSNISINRGTIATSSSLKMLGSDRDKKLVDLTRFKQPQFSLLRNTYPTSMGSYYVETSNNQDYHEGISIALTPILAPRQYAIVSADGKVSYSTDNPRNVLLQLQKNEYEIFRPSYSFNFKKEGSDYDVNTTFPIEYILTLDSLNATLESYRTKGSIDTEVASRDYKTENYVQNYYQSTSESVNYQKMLYHDTRYVIHFLDNALLYTVPSIKQFRGNKIGVDYSITYDALIGIVNSIAYPSTRSWKGFVYNSPYKIEGISGTFNSQGKLTFDNPLTANVTFNSEGLAIIRVRGLATGAITSSGNPHPYFTKTAMPTVTILLDIDSIETSKGTGKSRVIFSGYDEMLNDWRVHDELSLGLITNYNTKVINNFVKPYVAYSGAFNPQTGYSSTVLHDYDFIKITTKTAGGYKENYIKTPPLSSYTTAGTSTAISLYSQNLADATPHSFTIYQFNLTIGTSKTGNTYTTVITFNSNSYYNRGTENFGTNLSSAYIAKVEGIRFVKDSTLASIGLKIIPNKHTGVRW